MPKCGYIVFDFFIKTFSYGGNFLNISQWEKIDGYIVGKLSPYKLAQKCCHYLPFDATNYIFSFLMNCTSNEYFVIKF